MPVNRATTVTTTAISRDPLPDDVIELWSPDHVQTSQSYWEYLGNEARMLVTRRDGTVVGATPLRVRPIRIDFGAGTGGRNILTLKVPCVEVLGSRVDSLSKIMDPVGTIFAQFPSVQAIVFPSIEPGKFYSKYLAGEDSRFLFHSPRGFRLCHVATLPHSFGVYLDDLGSKGRNDIKRKVKKLDARGTVHLDVVTHPGQCNDMKSALDSLGVCLDGRVVGDGGVARLRAMAVAGLLRCFMLRSGKDIAAIVLGMKWHDTYYLDSTHTNKSILDFSPGTVLRHMMFQDLIGCGVTVVDYGYGEPGRVNSITSLAPRACVMTFRRNLKNRIVVGSHKMCHRLITLFKGFRDRQ